MYKFISFVISLILLFPSLSYISYAENISASHAVLLEAESGNIVYSKDAYTRASMASTTKIMTGLLAIEYGDMDKVVTVPKEAVGIEGSSIYLKEGEKLSLSDLVYALMLESANDAAVAIAITVGGSVEQFVNMMNIKAKQLGLDDTHFTNPHGLDNKEHYTSAYDLARLAKYAMDNPVFEEITSTKKKVIPLDNDGSRVLINHNKLLRMYDGTIGVKTGYTSKSGRCLVSCAEREGVRLICATIDAPNDWNDHKNILDIGFSEYEHIVLAEAGDYTLSLNCINSKDGDLLCTNYEGLSLTVKRDQKNNIRAVTEYGRLLSAPIKQGERVGQIVFYMNNEKIGVCPLYALESVREIKYRKSFLERIFS